MAGTGPQKFPGASTAYWYQNRFGGDLMEVNVVVLHTTEGTTLPDYGGGTSAPNLTAVPDFAAGRLRWYQHFDIDRSSRALVNLTGGVETNTLNVCQVELVGTCDPATHQKWTAAGVRHVYWPEAPDWALAGVAEFLAWVHAQHGVPLVGPSVWLAYPGSYGPSKARMTGAAWEAFKGVCGHQHVPENQHGDPGALDFTRLIALAKGAPIEEDPMPTADEIATAVLKKDGVIIVPGAPAPNPTWTLSSVQTEILKRIDAVRASEAAQTAAIAALAKLVGSGVDTAAVVAAVREEIQNAVVKVSVDVTGPQG